MKDNATRSMPGANRPRSRCFLFLVPCLLIELWGPATYAFPPAPYYTLYGTVRNQVGQALAVEGASLILLKGNEEVGRSPVSSGLYLDQNYELSIRIDQNRPSTRLYTNAAIPANGTYSLAVEMNGRRFYPIEVSGNLTAGKGGERVRLDLNLGEDSDGDGLPDIWEQWQLYQAGHLPGENGWNLALIDRDGDFDGDGQSNWLEYVAGTFAGDATQRFELLIKEKSETSVRLEFFAITGKVYTLESSGDGKIWSRIPFTVGADDSPAEAFRAESVGILSAYCLPLPAGTSELYRLTVR